MNANTLNRILEGTMKEIKFDSSVKYGLFLRYLLIKGTSEDKTLYVSAGEADWAYAFLSRLYQETTDPQKKPKIKKLVVLHLSQEEAQKCEENEKLPKGFCERMTLNINGLRDLAPKNNFIFRDVPVTEQPNYHGYLYGKWALLGEWKTIDGLNNVRTGLTAYKNDHKDNLFNLFKEMFIKKGYFGET